MSHSEGEVLVCDTVVIAVPISGISNSKVNTFASITTKPEEMAELLGTESPVFGILRLEQWLFF